MIVIVAIVVAITLAVLLSVPQFRPGNKSAPLEAVEADRIVQPAGSSIAYARYWRGGLVAVALVSAAVLLYWNFGRHDQTAPKQTAAPVAPVAGGAMDLSQLTIKLAARLEKNPEDGEGWLLLAKSYTQSKRNAEARQALAQALKRLPKNADVLADWVETRLMADNQAWGTEARQTLAAALAVNPAHTKALWLAGTEARDRGSYQEAERYWEKLSTLAGPESEYGRKAQAALKEARALAAGKKTPRPAS